MQLQIFGECMIFIKNYQKKQSKIKWENNVYIIHQVIIAKFTEDNIKSRDL